MHKTRTVDLYIFDRFADWEIGFAIAHLNSFEGQFLPSRYRVRTVGVTRTPIVSMGGLRITPDATLADVNPDECSMLILPGGPSWDQGGNIEAAETAEMLLKAQVPVAAICGATGGLARAGLLDNRKHTSNAKEYLAATGYGGDAGYVDSLAVSDENIVTAGSAGALEFAAEIFRRLDQYPPEVIDAWYGLFKTGEARFFGPLMAAKR